MNPSVLNQSLGTAETALMMAAVVLIVAPLAFSIAARSTLSAVVSIALLGTAGLTILTGKTVIHEVLAAVIYMAALLSASTIYGAARIETALRRPLRDPLGDNPYGG